jgi:membrane protease YdiL (CAAX protease family)
MESALAPSTSTPPVHTPAELLRPALVLWISSQLLMGVEAQLNAFLWRGGGNPWLGVWLFELGSVAFAVLVFTFVRRDPDARRVFVRPRPGMVELCVLVGIVMAFVLTTWERQLPAEFVGSSPVAIEHSMEWPIWACLLASAVLPAVFEELMYRGVLQQRFLRVMPARLAIALQAMLFSVMHFDHVLLLPHFLFGLVAGLLRQAAGALWPCMLMHFLWNGHIVLLTYDWL